MKKIEIPFGKALIPVKIRKSKKSYSCYGCFFDTLNGSLCIKLLDCHNRKDGKNVIFKLVEYKGEKE